MQVVDRRKKKTRRSIGFGKAAANEEPRQGAQWSAAGIGFLLREGAQVGQFSQRFSQCLNLNGIVGGQLPAHG
jgi:hypothetical protein